jgi:hypothetical protein
MRLVIPIIVASLAGLIGCTTVHPDAIRAVGAVWTVSHDDIRQAVAATGRAKEIAWVDVINRNKIEVYYRPLTSEWDNIERVHGTWQFTSTSSVLW